MGRANGSRSISLEVRMRVRSHCQRICNSLQGYVVAVLLGAMLLPAHSTVQTPPAEADWYRFDLPPLYIAEGEFRYRGIIDTVLSRLLKTAYPDRPQTITTLPLKRVELLLRQSPHACVLGLLKNPEREQEMLFSIPFLTQLPPGVFARRSDEARLSSYLDSNGKLNLTRVLKDGRLTVGIVGGRSYGATLDEMLAPYQGRPNVFVNHATKPYPSLMQMALAKRVDLVPGFPYEAQFLSRQDGIQLQTMRFYALSEQPKFLLGYAACAKSAVGQATIQTINEVLARKEFRDQAQHLYESWLDADARQLARQAHKLAN